jgi:hypothetical protein
VIARAVSSVEDSRVACLRYSLSLLRFRPFPSPPIVGSVWSYESVSFKHLSLCALALFSRRSDFYIVTCAE